MTDLAGHWGEVTANIEWCERNYEVTYYIAEFWNTLSSLAVCIAGTAHLYIFRKYTTELRFKVMAWSFVVIGLGSAAFHCTLRKGEQLLDEIPMLIAVFTYIYIWLEMRSLYNQTSRPYLAPLLMILFVAGTTVYLVYDFALLFQAEFAVCEIVAVVCVLKYTWQSERQLHSSILYSTYGYIGFMLLGLLIWVLDQMFCDQVFRPWNIQGHAIWHVAISYSCFLSLSLATLVRQTEVHNKDPELGYFFNCEQLPYAKSYAPKFPNK